MSHKIGASTSVVSSNETDKLRYLYYYDILSDNNGIWNMANTVSRPRTYRSVNVDDTRTNNIQMLRVVYDGHQEFQH